jgi:hypothetical protein|tara:strand:- start:61 stop:348 length:288 start_codon:yes stop_codon:yes gene_type:complete
MFLNEDIGKKATDVDTPYMIYEGNGFEWRVLKRYQKPENEKTNQYARWYCAVRSPFTHGSWEYGDTYISDIRSNAHVWRDYTGEDVQYGSILRKA